jgi:hypothetical protein
MRKEPEFKISVNINDASQNKMRSCAKIKAPASNTRKRKNNKYLMTFDRRLTLFKGLTMFSLPVKILKEDLSGRYLQQV